MQELGHINQIIIPLFGYNITINLEVIVMTWIVFIALIVLGLFTSWKKNILPRPMQIFGELIVTMLYDLTEDALGEEQAIVVGQDFGLLVGFLAGLGVVFDGLFESQHGGLRFLQLLQQHVDLCLLRVDQGEHFLAAVFAAKQIDVPCLVGNAAFLERDARALAIGRDRPYLRSGHLVFGQPIWRLDYER